MQMPSLPQDSTNTKSNPYARFSHEQLEQFCLNKDQETNGLRTELQRRRDEQAETDALMLRKDAKPDYKVFMYAVMRRLGVGFGRANENRPKEFIEIKIKDVAEEVNINPKTAGEYMAFLTKPTEERPHPVLRKTVVPKPRKQQSEDGQWSDTGTFYKQGAYAPSDPFVFNVTFDKAAHLPVPQQEDLPRKAQSAKHNGEKAAEARRILAECPKCYSTNITIECRDCGHKVSGADMPDAPRKPHARKTQATTAPSPSETDDPDDEEWEDEETQDVVVEQRCSPQTVVGAESAPTVIGSSGVPRIDHRAPVSPCTLTVGAESAPTVEGVNHTPTPYPTVGAEFTRLITTSTTKIEKEEYVVVSQVVVSGDVNSAPTVEPDMPPFTVGAESAPTVEDSPPPEEKVDMDAELMRITLPLTDGVVDDAHVLGHAIQALMPVVSGSLNHVRMQVRPTAQDAKYKSFPEVVTPSLLGHHLVGGSLTIGASFITSPPDADGSPLCRAVVYDDDEHFQRLITAAQKLANHGLTPLLVRNDTKKNSGHLWLIFAAEVPVERTFATLEQWAPELLLVPEKFPNLSIRGGGRLRLPGGLYYPVGQRSGVPVCLGLVGDGVIDWTDATGPEGWNFIRDAVMIPSVLQGAFVSPGARPRPKPKVAAPPTPTRRATSAGDTIQDAVDRFNHEKSIRDQVRDISRDGMFSSPFHEDKNPSCKLYEDGHWCDFSAQERHRFDALDYYCARAGLWTDQERRTDPDVRVKVLRDLGYLQTLGKVKQDDKLSIDEDGGCVFVSVRAAERPKFDRAIASLVHTFEGVEFDEGKKMWRLPLAITKAQADGWRMTLAKQEIALRQQHGHL